MACVLSLPSRDRWAGHAHEGDASAPLREVVTYRSGVEAAVDLVGLEDRPFPSVADVVWDVDVTVDSASLCNRP